MTEETQRRVLREGEEGDAFRTAFGYNVPPEEKIKAFKLLIMRDHDIHSAAVVKQGLQLGDVGLKSGK